MKQLYFLILLIIIFNVGQSQVNGIYVSDAGNFEDPPYQIMKYDLEGGTPEVFIADNVDWPQEILFLTDSNIVLISNAGDGRINRHNATTGEFINTFATMAATPTRMQIGEDGLLYVLKWGGDGKVAQFNLDGEYLGNYTTVGVPQSIGMAWDDEGNLYISSYTGGYVRKFDSDGNTLGLFIEDNLVGPTNIWFASNGDMLVSDFDGGAVKRFDSEGNYLSVFISGLSQSEGIDTLENGNILIGNGGTGAVKMYTSEGVFIEDIVPSGSGGLIRPNAVVVVSNGVSEIHENENIHFSIQPTIGHFFTIYSSELIEENLTAVVLDAMGKEYIRFALTQTASWRANSAPAGVYFIHIYSNELLIGKERIVVLE